MAMKMDEAVLQAQRLFVDSATSLGELTGLSQRLMRGNKLDDARRLLERALFEFSGDAVGETRVRVARDLILCTYKDPDLPVDFRLKQAEQMLRAALGEPLLATVEAPPAVFTAIAPFVDGSAKLKQDLWGIAGAVQKRRWEVYGLRRHLVQAQVYYRRGYEMGPENDQGYTAVNLAFVLDLLAEQEKVEPGHGALARAEALAVRNHLLSVLEPAAASGTEARADAAQVPVTRSWWELVTLGETLLGVGEYDRAARWMAEAAAVREAAVGLDAPDGLDAPNSIAPWQLETAVRQIAQLASIQAGRAGIGLQGLETSEPWRVVKALLREDITARSFLIGKVGLALSGGGFRASLFHIGVLARLAELDVLRHVEVLSCVSGGSILGAYYYLELRKLLQTKTDGEITRADYIALVQRICRDFVRGVQRNLRMRMLFGWRSNLAVLTSRRSSTSDRLAILYEEELYARIDDGEARGPRYLADLRIFPCIGKASAAEGAKPVQAREFNPKYENWTRQNKVPALVLNATTLNTCHNWQFTASFMGEPPARSVDAEIDANHRLRRMYHWEAPPAYRRGEGGEERTAGVRLGEAVAASACVPGLFDPVLLEDLYGEQGPLQERYATRLVDGGNYDNQGIATLREQDCNVLLVSDACGQTGIKLEPSPGHFGASTRANDILMSRTRESQYQLLATLADSGTIRGMMYLHLKKGVQAQVVDWVGCTSPSPYATEKKLTEYGVRTDLQRLLADVRTDLDSFSWLEADALMLSGYRMTAREWATCLPELPVDGSDGVAWPFQKIDAVMTTAAEGGELGDLERALRVAADVAFKPMRLIPMLRWAFVGLGVAAMLGVLWVVLAFWGTTLERLHPVRWVIVPVAGLMVLVAVKEWVLARTFRYRNSYAQIVVALFMCVCGWAVFYLYLWIIDPLYVNWRSGYRKEKTG